MSLQLLINIEIRPRELVFRPAPQLIKLGELMMQMHSLTSNQRELDCCHLLESDRHRLKSPVLNRP
jgi:hypothetical protein